MKLSKTLFTALTLTAITALTSAVFADTAKVDAHHNTNAAQPAAGTAKAVPAGDADMTNAEVRKVDKDSKKITLKHEEIKSLEMPGMTMVFQVKDAALLDKTKAGDKVRFKVIKDGNAYVVTELTVKD